MWVGYRQFGLTRGVIGHGLSLVCLADAEKGRLSSARCREKAGRRVNRAKGAGWGMIRAVGKASTTSIWLGKGRQRTEASVKNAGSGIRPKKWVGRREKRGGKRKEKRKENEEKKKEKEKWEEKEKRKISKGEVSDFKTRIYSIFDFLKKKICF